MYPGRKKTDRMVQAGTTNRDTVLLLGSRVGKCGTVYHKGKELMAKETQGQV